MIVNFCDINISHAECWTDALEKGRKTKHIKYNKLTFVEDGYLCLDPETIKLIDNYETIIFSDKLFGYADQFPSKFYKIAWTMEPRAYDPEIYRVLESNISNFDLILTWDKYLLETYPEKCEFIPADGLFVDTKSIYQKSIVKTKNVSHIFSDKKDIAGHKLRHEIAAKLKGFDCYGRGTKKPLEYKSDALNDYRFSIVIENNRAENYFTEKILDCFACRTIPVYWGAPNIKEFFDPDSIIIFDTVEELENIIPSLNNDLYEKFSSSLQVNYQKALQYYDFDEFIYQAIKKRNPNV